MDFAPNVSKQRERRHGASSNPASAELIDATGRTVPAEVDYRTDAVTVRCRTLPIGNYFVRLYGLDGIATRRVLVGDVGK